jgi:hypothetical protein
MINFGSFSNHTTKVGVTQGINRGRSDYKIDRGIGKSMLLKLSRPR